MRKTTKENFEAHVVVIRDKLNEVLAMLEDDQNLADCHSATLEVLAELHKAEETFDE